MGQAFDEKGNVLGEAYGETKREVFDKLSEAHPDAAEMRIKTMAAQQGAARDINAPAHDSGAEQSQPAPSDTPSTTPSTPQGDGDSGDVSSDSGDTSDGRD